MNFVRRIKQNKERAACLRLLRVIQHDARILRRSPSANTSAVRLMSRISLGMCSMSLPEDLRCRVDKWVDRVFQAPSL